MAEKSTNHGWLQLLFFTVFLFLLVAIPYTVYLKASAPKAAVKISDIPTIGSNQTQTTPTPAKITPPAASGSTNCQPAPANYAPNTSATPSSYLVNDNGQEVCFPPTLPPYPFIWTVYKDFQHGVMLDIPSNWTEKVISQGSTTLHNYYQETPTASSAADISFGWYTGKDPLATDTTLLHQQVTNGTVVGVMYTKGRDFIAGVFPKTDGYLLLKASTADTAFFAFQHMFLSLQFSK